MEQKEVGASARHNCGEATVGHPADGSERAGFSGGVRAVHYLAAPARRMLLIRRIGSYQLPLSGSGAGGSWRLRPPEFRRGSGRPPGHETLPDRSPFVNGLPSTPFVRKWSRRELNPRSLECDSSVFPLNYCPIQRSSILYQRRPVMVKGAQELAGLLRHRPETVGQFPGQPVGVLGEAEETPVD